jgi:tryptophan halogenase
MDPSIPVSANAFRLARDGSRVALEFGRVDGVPIEAGAVSIRITDRISIPLDTARRMLVGLDEALKPYAERLRAEEAKALSPAAAAAATRPTAKSVRPTHDASGEKAAQLLRAVGAWGVPHQYERSLRLSAGSLQSNRFLLTVNRSDIPRDALAQTLSLCEQFGMPRAQRDAAGDAFGMARCVHFGFEGDPGSSICKLYLERDVTRDEARHARATNQPALLHLSFKWNVDTGEAVTTRYHWRPALTGPEIEARFEAIFRDTTPAFNMARSLLHQAMERSAPEDLQFLEVEEAENDRRSFDLNVYRARLLVRDVQPLLQEMRAHFNVRPGQFQALYDQIRGLSLGHLAGGLHRNGKEFFNLYYGAVGLPHYNEKL